MAQRLEVDNSAVVAKSDDVSRLLLADSTKAPPTDSNQKGSTDKKIADVAPKANTELAMIGPGVGLWLAAGGGQEKQEGEKPKPAAQKTAEEAKTVASVVSGMSDRVIKDGILKDADRDSIHTEFNKQLAQTDKYRPEERAAQLRSFISAANEKLLSDKSGLYFTENKSPGKDQISVSLVDKGEKSLVGDKPTRTVYDTEVYNVGTAQIEAKNVPSREQVPDEARNAYDFTKSGAKKTVMDEKYKPALKQVVEETGVAKLERQEDRNAAVGLPRDSSLETFNKELEKRMMTKLGQPGADYAQAYNQDLNREFVKALGLKPGQNTQQEIVEALKKVKVPSDFKKD